MNDNQMINQMDLNKMLQIIQKNNDQIIQMIQQIFQVQMLNNMLLNQILNNNLNINIRNNELNDLMSRMNNFMNNLNNENIMSNNMMNMVNNNHSEIDPWEGNFASRINVVFELTFLQSNDRFKTLYAPLNITVKELIEAFIKKFNIEKNNVIFLFNAKELKKDDSTKIESIMNNLDRVRVVECGV